MPTLENVLGAIVSSIASARRMADEQTVAIAEHYQSSPLLKGLTVPRLRLPEISVDLPLVVDSQADGSDGEPEKETVVYTAIRQELSEVERELRLRLPTGFLPTLQSTFKKHVKKRGVTARTAKSVYSDAINTALADLAADERFKTVFSRNRLAFLQKRLGARATSVAVKRPALHPHMNVKVTTDEVKNNSDPQTVTRIKIIMREEGLEWAEYEKEDGTLSQRLIPE